MSTIIVGDHLYRFCDGQYVSDDMISNAYVEGMLFRTRVLMSEWLPSSYLFNQAVLLALGFAAIIHRGSALQVELVLYKQTFRCTFNDD